MSLDNIARASPMKGKWVVKRRGMFVNHLFNTERQAQDHADSLNALAAELYLESEKRKNRGTQRSPFGIGS